MIKWASAAAPSSRPGSASTPQRPRRAGAALQRPLSEDADLRLSPTEVRSHYLNQLLDQQEHNREMAAELQDVRLLDPDDPLLEREHRGHRDYVYESEVSGGVEMRPKSDTRRAMSEEELNYRYHSYDPRKYMVKQEKYLKKKNLIVICVAFTLNFTAFLSMQNLQSSLNRQGGLGLVGLAVIYLALVLSSLLLPTLFIQRAGCKWSLTLAFLPYAAYMAANFYPSWATIIPTAFLLGLSGGVLWSAKCTYLTEIGAQYASLTGEDRDAVITRFFGYFCMAFQTAQIWGNLISSFILQDLPVNGTFIEESSFNQCGKFYCNELDWDIEGIKNANFRKPDTQKLYILLAVLTSLSLLACLVPAVLLDKLKKRIITDPIELTVYEEVASGQRRGAAGRQVSATLRQWRHGNQILLIPISIYCGLQQAFIIGDFTKSYVSCSLGIWMVGMILMCFGLSNAIFSGLFGKIAKYTGHPLLFSFGAVVHCGCLLGLFFWEPASGTTHLYLFFILAALWGMGDAVWQTQLGAFYGCVFITRKEPAFANFRLWEALGFIAAFVYSGFLCTYIKICILLGTLGLGMLGYFIIECRRRCELEDDDEDEHVTDEKGRVNHGVSVY